MNTDLTLFQTNFSVPLELIIIFFVIIIIECLPKAVIKNTCNFLLRLVGFPETNIEKLLTSFADLTRLQIKKQMTEEDIRNLKENLFKENQEYEELIELRRQKKEYLDQLALENEKLVKKLGEMKEECESAKDNYEKVKALDAEELKDLNDTINRKKKRNKAMRVAIDQLKKKLEVCTL